MSIKVLLADDSNVVRTAIVHILAQDPVGEAATFAETLRLTAALKPDILVLDLHMPDEPEYSRRGPWHLRKTKTLWNESHLWNGEFKWNTQFNAALVIRSLPLPKLSIPNLEGYSVPK
jgi:hypothetical protein